MKRLIACLAVICAATLTAVPTVAPTVTAQDGGEAAFSKFRLKTDGGRLSVQVYQPGLVFALEDGVLIVEHDNGDKLYEVATGSPGSLTLRQGDLEIESGPTLSLRQGGSMALTVTISPGGTPLAALQPSKDQLPQQTVTEAVAAVTAAKPAGPAEVPVLELLEGNVPPKIKIEE